MKTDDRPKRGMWAPGTYMCKCANCEAVFSGDKRAFSCADCAYNNGWRFIESAPKDGHDILATVAGIGQPVRIAFWEEARGGVWSMWPGREPMEPTHWKPGPRGPSEPETASIP